MHAGFKRREFVAGIVVILVVVLLATCHRAPKAPGHVTLTFLGYTNAPNNNSRFALFAVTNLTGHDIRYFDEWVQVEGRSARGTEILNPAQSAFTRDPVLRAGGSLALAVADPLHAPETARWRFTLVLRRYSLGLRWFDFAVRYRLPFRLGAIKLVDFQRIQRSDLDMLVSSDWLTH